MGIYLGKREKGVPNNAGGYQFQMNVDGAGDPWIECNGEIITILTDKNTGGFYLQYTGVDFDDLTASSSGQQVGDLGYAYNSQGTQWLPGPLLGTYYPAGFYVWDGVNWVSDRNAIAEQLQVSIDDITTLQGQVGANTANISTNTGNISTNASGISTNATDISTNAGDISTNAANIATNSGNISTNAGNISTNAAGVSTNAGNISTNSSNITDLQNDKADKTITIGPVAGETTGGGDLSANRTIGLADTSVTPGSYTNVNLTVDAKGRITAASNGSAGSSFYKVEKSEDYSRAGQTTEGLINQQANTYENYLTLPITAAATSNHVIKANFIWSYNDGGQDFLVRLRVMQGAAVVAEYYNPEIFMEPQDTGGGGEVLNTLAGGVIIGNANTGTNQRYSSHFEFNADLTSGQNYTVELDWTSNSGFDEAAMYRGEVTVEQKTITP